MTANHLYDESKNGGGHDSCSSALWVTVCGPTDTDGIGGDFLKVMKVRHCCKNKRISVQDSMQQT